ncbi:hypothetical protein EKO27_g5508 [Xylaria grammica]|uniref:Capsule polysaccharide biosynthesis protein n=1 Tax=Xylaria grammica TaxID=363999 RepID=A0A439D5C2_9PEZI|nr:hypothetical protein EKO27_g5508 [Xylaria grammica]
MGSTLDAKPFRPVTPGITLILEGEIDSRSDEELIETLRHPVPVRHERNVWAFWNTGFDNMRPWTQRNVLGWIRRQEFRAAGISPQVFQERHHGRDREGPTRQRYGEIAPTIPARRRLARRGSILLRNFDDIFWRDLEDPDSPYQMGITLFQSRKYIGQCLTGFFGAKKGNPFIERWMRLWLELWKDGRTNCLGLHEHPLIQPLGLIVPPEAQEHENPRQIDLGGAGVFDLKITTDYLALNMAYERVRLLKDDETGWNGPEYFRRHVHLLDTIDEVWKSHEMLLQDELFPLLSLPFEPEHIETDAQQKTAAGYVGHVLANCSIAKYSQGHWQPGARVPLAMTWSMPENADADIKKGTWAEYFRWASVFCNQTRLQRVCLPSLKLPEEKDEIINAGLLEAK